MSGYLIQNIMVVIAFTDLVKCNAPPIDFLIIEATLTTQFTIYWLLTATYCQYQNAVSAWLIYAMTFVLVKLYQPV